MSEPVPVISLEYAKPADEERFRAWRRINRLCLVLGAGASVVAWLLLFREVRWVVASGPTIFVIGALMLTGGPLRKRPWIWGSAWRTARSACSS